MKARSSGDRVAVTVLLLVVAALVAAQTLGRDGADADGRPPAVAGDATTAIGVTTLSLARNSYEPWSVGGLREVDDFERQAGARAGIVMWFADWKHSRFSAWQARMVAARRAVPEITWEPWDASIGPRRRQSRYTLASIIGGRHDAYVRRFAAAVADYGGPVRIRFAHEMNGNWYPWSERANGNRRGEFVRAWRHVHGIFSQAGASNVTWVWAPVTGEIPGHLYPGDGYVDVVGLSGLNGGASLFSRRWKSFPTAFAAPLDTLARLAPGKPIALSEVASTEFGGDKARWIREMFHEIKRRPAIRSVTWFNLRKETDWRISSSRRARSAFAKGVLSLGARRPDQPSAATRPR